MIALDTNVVSELVRPEPNALVVAWIDEQPTADLAVSAVTAAELRYGVARLPDGARQRALSAAVEALLGDVFGGRVLPFDAAASVVFGELVAARERAGRPISMADGQIASICVSANATLATRNVRDFEATGIALIDPWAAR